MSSSITSTASDPPCRMLLRSKDGVELYKVPSSNDNDNDDNHGRNWLLKGSTTLQVVSPDGQCAFFHQSSVGVVKCDLSNNSSNCPEAKKPFLEDSKKVAVMGTSPKGTHLVTWEKLNTETQHPNLKVWNSRTGVYECGFVQKHFKRDAWPYVQWTHDEKYAFLLATNEVRVYDGNAFFSSEDKEIRYIDKLRCQGMVSMSVPNKATSQNDGTYLLTVFCPTNKDKPGRVSLLQYPATVPPTTKNTTNNNAYPALVSKSLYQVEEVTVHWSPKGDSALVAMQTSVDTTGQSYYGSATLHLFSAAEKEPITVPLPSDGGPVLDVAWMPNASKPPTFAVIAGKMPSMASLHHGSTAEAVFLFGNAHRNTVSWSPHGRFLCLAGFGNLQGGMTFWDRNKLKVIPQYHDGTVIEMPQPVASCTVGFGWSPDSRMVYSSTVSPRMNVDNGVKLYKYNGALITSLPWKNEWYQPDRLLEAVFVPASSEDAYPDRPQSPPPKGVVVAASNKTTTTTAAAAAATSPTTTKSAGRYVPPAARGKGSGGMSLAERMRKEKESSMMGATKVTKTTTGIAMPGKKVIPGMTPTEPSSKSSKNAARKERLRAAKAKRQQEEEAAAAAAKAQQEQQQQTASVDPEKRARKIKKTLKQIEELKEKQELNEDQRKKIASEHSLRDELAKLGL